MVKRRTAVQVSFFSYQLNAVAWMRPFAITVAEGQVQEQIFHLQGSRAHKTGESGFLWMHHLLVRNADERNCLS